MREYLLKMKGGAKSPPRIRLAEIFWSWTGSFSGIGAVAFLSFNFFESGDLTLIIGSFGASAVLIFAAIRSPLAQPRNLIGGHVLSAIIGVSAYQMMGDTWMASAFAVSSAIAVMLFTDTLHPPGGATALIAVIGSEEIHNIGYLYVFVPTLAGALIMLVIALLVNNLAEGRKYPEYWY
ncbi:CBS-domain-containing membrane protein [Candidatus Methanoperedens nitroreducens]|uniref:CBS-domain-containing membrane protein n=1 Tax=Candidatus Methanoperedens nitratireducens TaxID=1392998 RepID=A0A062V194_9EURY|nr:HPP family protein [Candidatus Methanoperedens nitroreducens]KCZ70388.1 CBS-domain-containing membrane protein [Candidatus Methanoperedens nitroreducens]MDJ1420828.1 HPP family protein [Candidatus Methanoperedens sp.]